MTDDPTQSFRPVPPTSPVQSGGAPIEPDPPQPDLRVAVHRLSRGLIAYGIIGLIVAVIGLGSLAWLNGRIDAAGQRVTASMDPLATTLERTAQVLHDASTTAQTFSVTLDRTQASVSAAADTIIAVRTNLETLRDVLGAVNILGVAPLGPAAGAVDGIAGSIEGLDARLTIDRRRTRREPGLTGGERNVARSAR